MPIEPIKIPQNVYIEDRIVGPLTLKQIIIVAIGCGFSYALYSLLVQSYGKIPLPVTVLAWVPGALSFVFAFIKINDLSLFRLCLLLVERINKPSIRTWSPRRGLSINIRTFSTPDKHAKDADAPAAKNMDHLQELSAVLDQQTRKPSPLQEPVSPLEETIDHADTSPVLPVNPARVSASPRPQGSISIFRDLSPQH